ncbi:hypothetical protein J7I98_08695 [Streptomyces sp. ISL-98]|uniref:hypothetical protein n=1 Tax=Streptomyces sp. ISL-98 TaxID=2819192 RepID=UPI001BE84BBC|nr:hypothetical protein [Streptomyces sp. ISL-98]MBT2505970.1 hypothetical protein [Streptomyces sp. ISL-98]
MFRTWISRVGTACAASALVLGVAGSAHADDSYLRIGNGYFKHNDEEPDSFQVCDTKAGGPGVTGKLYVMVNTQPTQWVLLKTWTDGDDAGCGGGGFDLGNSPYMWTIKSGSQEKMGNLRE